MIVNLFGTSATEYGQLAAALDALEDVDGVEINLSCPNVQAGGIEFGRDPQSVAQVVRYVRQATRKFVAVKLSPASDVVPVAQACAAAAADAISMGNTMPAFGLGCAAALQSLGGRLWGLSGPALRPITLHCVRRLFNNVKIAHHRLWWHCLS